MIFVCGCAVVGYMLGASIGDGGTLVGTTLGIIGAAVVSGVGVQLIRTLGKQSNVSDAQIVRHVTEINRLNTELDRERERCARLEDRCARLEDDNARLRRELIDARK